MLLAALYGTLMLMATLYDGILQHHVNVNVYCTLYKMVVEVVPLTLVGASKTQLNGII